MTNIDLGRLRKNTEDTTKNLVVVDVVDSTHAMARRILEQVDEDGSPMRPTLIIASRQIRGQGRGDRLWASPEGGLYCNWLDGNIDTALVPKLPMIAASAAYTAIANAGVKDLHIKWPNDLLVADRKIAGLLVHCRHAEQVLVTVGLGVNIGRTPNLDGEAPVHTPTSLLDQQPEADPTEAASAIVLDFVKGLLNGVADPQHAIDIWRNHLLHTEGDELTVRTTNGELMQGVFGGVTADGHVRLTTEDGDRTLSGGDIIED